MFIKLYLIALPVFFALDMLWLGIIAKGLYRAQIGHLMKDEVNWTAAGIFYLLFIAGLVVFVLMPAVEKNSLWQAAVLGAFFGFICYATYDLTNLAVAKDWPILITVIDLMWGAVLATLVSVITFVITTRLGA